MPTSLHPEVDTAEAVGRSAMRKVRLRIVPLIGLGYCAAYIDRVNISFAALGMNRDLHLSATVYGFGAGLFFLSYAASEIPSNLALHRFGARVWLSRIMITWGLLAMGMMLVRTPHQFYLARFLLGMAEAGFFPGVVYYFMRWFPPELRASAFSQFYIALPLSSVFMGAAAGALLGLEGRAGLHGWQWLFLVEGLPPILLGIVFLFFLPSSPADAKWLTTAEKQWIHQRTTEDAASVTHSHGAIAAALRNRRIWQLGFFNLMCLGCSYAYTFSAPSVLQAATGFSSARIGYIVAALSLLGAGAMLLGARFSDSRQRAARALGTQADRYAHILPWCGLLAGGFLVYGLGHTPVSAILGLGIVILGFNGMQGPAWALPASFLRDPTGRRAAVGVAVINMIAMFGGFLGPYWIGFMRDLTGSYGRGIAAMALPALGCAAIIATMRKAARRDQPEAPKFVQ
ncbi:MFS transporter [Terriglobus roseus]|uniref:MFS transporter, ACS family, tartrate transporter n=1 Tax=Terriglobus roseus TaxID=392734 RepID=A0A1H4PQN0_9BACT|nr:MFS transporter [Terriglobus roseus]SEC09665.1 MFS transporter, ACS family, tartrate transporter [Terriglobus roseus]